MTAIKSKAHIKQLAEQRLPVPSADVQKVMEENERLAEALEDCILQIIYMQEKFGETGSGNAIISRARAALSNTQET